MKQIINKIYTVCLGCIDPTIDPDIRNKVVISNALAFLCILVASTLFLMFYYLGFHDRALIFIMSIISLSFVPLLSYKKYYNLSRLMLGFAGILSILLCATLFGLKSGLFLFFLFAAFCPYIIYTDTEQIYRYIFTSFNYFCAILFFLANYFQIPKPIALNVPSGALIFISFIITMFLISITVAIFTYQNKIYREKLEDEKRKAEKLARIKGDFLANMSHEIRTPMNGIIGMAELLLKTEQTIRQKNQTDIIYASGKHLLGLINDILDVSKIEAGKMLLDRDDFVIRTCIEEALVLSISKLNQKNIALYYHIDSEVPTSINSDMLKIRQILINLVGNALKFTQKGEVKVTLDIISQIQNKAILQFCVADTGIGINKNKKSTLFDAFVQADQKHEGTGLGLTIVAKIVTLMGGKIWVKSQPNKGAQFYFTIKTTLIAPLPLVYLQKEKYACFKDKQIMILSTNFNPHQEMIKFCHYWGMKVLLSSDYQEVEAWLTKLKKLDILLMSDDFVVTNGLAIAQGICHKFRGNIESRILLSSPEKESQWNCFDCYLTQPLQLNYFFNELWALLNPIKKNNIEQNRKNILSKNIRILVADDNSVNQLILSYALKDHGYQVELAENGIEVLQKLEQEHCALIFMDIQMPKMDGIEATHQIFKKYPNKKHRPIIIAATANAIRGDREKYLKLGMDDYISKPIDLALLFQKLEIWLTDNS